MSTLLENPGHANNWIGLKLTGVNSNRSAIGARIKVQTATDTFYRTVNTGSSFGDTPLEQNIGLGAAKTITSLDIQWPSGLTQHFTNIPANALYQLKENNPALTPLQAPAFPYAHNNPTHHH
jgi:hypothetical protein